MELLKFKYKKKKLKKFFKVYNNYFFRHVYLTKNIYLLLIDYFKYKLYKKLKKIDKILLKYFIKTGGGFIRKGFMGIILKKKYTLNNLKLDIEFKLLNNKIIKTFFLNDKKIYFIIKI
jgi:hypothetical protein